MSARGIREAEVWRTEQIQHYARTSDPPSPSPGDEWVRTDIQPVANSVAELRIKGPGGLLKAPVFDPSVTLGSDVYVGRRYLFSDGSMGLLLVTDQGGAIGSPRIVTSSGTELEAHDDVEVSAIPDSVVNNLDIWYPADEGSGSTLNDDLDTSPATFNQTPTWQSFSGAIGGTAPELDGTDNFAESDKELSTSGAVSLCGWVYFTQSPPFHPFAVTEDRSSQSDGFAPRIESDGVINVGTTSSGKGGGASVSFTPSQNTWYFIGSATDGSSNWLYVWDNSSNLGSGSSSSYSILPSTPFAEIGYLNPGFSEYYGGVVDGVGYRLDAALFQSEFESIWQDTQR